MSDKSFTLQLHQCQTEGITKVAGLLMLVLLLNSAALATVTSNHQITTGAYNPINPSITVDSNLKIHVVWQDLVSGVSQIFYSSSTDGQSWTPRERLSDSSEESQRPRIAAYGDNLYVVWQDNELNRNRVYLKHSSNGGSTWPAAVLNPAHPNYDSTGPDIAVSPDGTLCIVWEDHRAGTRDIYYNTSSDSGANFDYSNGTVFSSSSQSQNTPRVASDSNNLFHIVWFANNNIYYNNLQNPNSPIAVVNLSDSAYSSKNPAITCTGNQVHVAWQDFEDISWNIHYRTYFQGQWQSAFTSLIENPGTSEYPALTGDSTGNVHAVWQDRYSGNSEIYYRKREFGQPPDSWESVVKLTDNETGDSLTPVAIASNSEDTDNGVHIVWVFGGNLFYTQLPKDGLSGTNPDVTELHPADNSTGIAPNTKVWAVFDMPMEVSSVEDPTTFKLYVETAPGSGTWSEVAGTTQYFTASRKLTFTPDNTLSFSTRYKASLTSQAMSQDGERFPGRIWHFTTASDLVSGTGDIKVGSPLAYPSPWRGTGNINLAYTLDYDPAESVKEAWVSIYGPRGRRLYRERADFSGGASIHEWDGYDSRGNRLGNGLYFFRVDATLSNGNKSEARGTIMILR